VAAGDEGVQVRFDLLPSPQLAAQSLARHAVILVCEASAVIARMISSREGVISV
jgi:hypothetical protein